MVLVVGTRQNTTTTKTSKQQFVAIALATIILFWWQWQQQQQGNHHHHHTTNSMRLPSWRSALSASESCRRRWSSSSAVLVQAFVVAAPPTKRPLSPSPPGRSFATTGLWFRGGSSSSSERAIATTTTTSGIRQRHSASSSSSSPSLTVVTQSRATSVSLNMRMGDSSSSSSSFQNDNSNSNSNSNSNNNNTTSNDRTMMEDDKLPRPPPPPPPSRVNGDDEAQNNVRRQQRTGWFHNLPKASSNFWVSPPDTATTTENDDDDAPGREAPTTDSTTTTTPSTTLRTGWLHNQKAPSSSKQSQSQQEGSEKQRGTNLARPRLQQAKAMLQQSQRNHRILSPGVVFHTTSTGCAKIAVTEHLISVPLRYNNNNNKNNDNNKNKNNDDDATTNPQRQQQQQAGGTEPRLNVYFTIIERVDSLAQEQWLQHLTTISSPTLRAQYYVQQSPCSTTTADQWCLYLQGGPGFGAPAPVASLGFASPTASWAAHALHQSRFGCNRVVLLDQRGTGKSTPLTKQTLQRVFPHLFLLDALEQPEKNRNATAAAVAAVVEPDDAEIFRNNLDQWEQSHPEETRLVRQAIHDVTEYLTCFRADSIVRDAELVREALLSSSSSSSDAMTPLDSSDRSNDDNDDDDKNLPNPWGACLGQSYGGFTLMTYLSQTEITPPRLALFTGGIAPMLAVSLHDVYTRLWHRVRRRSLQYYQLYPSDVPLVKRIVQRLLQQAEPLPSTGGVLTARRFLQMGLNYLGSSPSSFAAFHALLSSSLVACHGGDKNEDISKVEFHRAFLRTIENSQVFDDHPIYYWLHESIYANGGGGTGMSGENEDTTKAEPTAWAAHRAYQDLVKAAPHIWDYRVTSLQLHNDTMPTLFFGEMVFPWMSHGDYGELSGLGLRHVAHALAYKTDWPRQALWNATQMQTALSQKNGTTRAAAAVYYDDLYVDFDCSMQVVEQGPLEQCKVYVTNEYQHSGLRDDGATIFAKLHGMATGTTRIPS